MRCTKRFLAIAISLFSATPFQTIVAANYNVNLTLDAPDAAPGDGVCSYDNNLNPNEYAVCTLRAAVMEGNAADVQQSVKIVLTPGSTYKLTIPGAAEQASATADLDVKRPMFIGIPSESKERARVDANKLDRAFHFFPGSGTSQIYGLEIVNGLAGSGTAIFSQAEELRIKFADISGNNSPTDDSTGAIHVAAGTLVLVDSRVHHNGNGVGINNEVVSGVRGFGYGPVDLIIDRSLIDNNESSGISLQDTLYDADENPETEITNSVTLTNSTLSDNGRWGISVSNSNAVIKQSTIRLNNLRQIQWHVTSLVSGLMANLELRGSIVEPGEESGNEACWFSIGEGSTFERSYNIYGDDSCDVNDGESDVGSLSDTFVEFGPLSDNGGATLTFLPSPSSPAIDQVPMESCEPLVDQRSAPRPASYFEAIPSLCDIGAAELQPPVSLIFSDSFSELADP